MRLRVIDQELHPKDSCVTLLYQGLQANFLQSLKYDGCNFLLAYQCALNNYFLAAFNELTLVIALI